MTTLVAAPAGLRRPAARAAHAGVKLVAVVVLVAVMATTGIEGGPAVLALVRVPGQLDHGLGSAAHYNSAMARVVQLEHVVITELAALDEANAAVARVGPAVENLDGQLRAVAARVETATAGPLAASDLAVAQLDRSLTALETQVRALGSPVAGSAAALTSARLALGALLAAARPLAADVSRARQAGHTAAANAVGP